MYLDSLRGIAVVDAGATNTKVVLFSSKGRRLAERKATSRHVEGPPYRHIDPQAVAELCREALPELDRIAPVDAVVPCAHGAALALIARDGSLAMPIMDYTAEPPQTVVQEYHQLEPPFSEVYCRLLPMALTHGLQLYWQERDFPVEFGKTTTILTWIQYVGHMLGAKAVSEISSLSCQSQLMDVRENRFSSLARARGWDRLFAPLAKAWETIGELRPEFKGSSFRGRGLVLAGVHDSNANYLRYLAAGFDSFTLLSSGTWIIGFNPSTPLTALKHEQDTASNTDILGRPVSSCRFYGGREFEIIAQGAPTDSASLSAVAQLVTRKTMALPSFTNSGGPIANSGGKGRIDGPAPHSSEERASLAALYCALMVSEALDAIESRNDIIIDGPFAQNAVFVTLLAQLRAARSQKVFLSDVQEGTTSGAACLALMQDEKLPELPLSLREVVAAHVPGLAEYWNSWRARTHGGFG
jgi:sugar (pentulose or hexulose) kinase